jgi:hypothetical protein
MGEGTTVQHFRDITKMVGWFRPSGRRQRWRQVVTGGGYRECWDRLLVERLPSGELIVLRDGERP